VIDRSVIGTRTPGESLLVTRSRLRAFAKATGQTDPVYVDPAAAADAGHRDLPVPPTFLFGIDLEAPDPFRIYTDLGIDLRRVLHGEQAFTYHAMAYAGDELRTSSVITDVYDKKGGLLEFLVRLIEVHDQDDRLVAEMTTTLVVQNPATPTPEEA
jgi:acyl dehydratase